MKSLTDIIKEDLGKLFNKNGKADLNKTYIICDSAKANWGKTETLRQLISELSSANSSDPTYPQIKIYKTSRSRDRYAFFIINDVKIFVGTAGDSEPIVRRNLEMAFDWKTGDQTEGSYKPNVVIIASRSAGKSLRTIKSVSTEHACNIIWFDNFHDNGTSSDVLRDEVVSTSVESIISLIGKLFA